MNSSVGEGYTPLTVLGVETYAKENGEQHKTDKYELVQEKTPILRRGQSFYLGLQLDREYAPQADRIILAFDFGNYSLQYFILKNRYLCVILPKILPQK